MLPLSKYQKASIIKNILAAVQDINELDIQGYLFLIHARGFEQYSGRSEFIDYYSLFDLAKQIKDNYALNKLECIKTNLNTFEYYQSRAEIYKRIVDQLTTTP